jgi:SAM-dependent methyltransferase
MSIFQSYANLYDTIYEDKDYLTECKYIQYLFDNYGCDAVKSILDLGCGTGSHTIHFADMGYHVVGIDASKEMLDIARHKSISRENDIQFFQQDIRELCIDEKFDAVVAMFAVIGYQITNNDLDNTFQSVYRHLNDDGIFIFDVWFGPAVFAVKPEDRVKIMYDGNKRIIRYAHPELNIVNQTVIVHYHVIEIENCVILQESEEKHEMRFLFYQELKYILNNNGFSLLHICPFMKPTEEPSDISWNISVICKKEA